MESSPAVDDVVVLSPRAFRGCWWLILSYHLFVAVFAAVVAFAHLVAGASTVYPNLLMLAISQQTLVIAGWTYVVIALLQLAFATRHVVQSLRRRRLSFGYDDDTETPMNSGADSSWPSWHSFKSTLTRWETKLLGDTHSGAREVAFQLQQLMEIVLQTYQANQLSRSVARSNLHVFVVAVIVANCVHTPLLDLIWTWHRHRQRHRYRRRSSSNDDGTSKVLVYPAMVRFTHLRVVVLRVVDIWLDFQIAVVVPIAILVPHLLSFDWEAGYFPPELAYDDAWATRAINEGRQVLVATPLDFVSSISPHVLGMISLRFIKSKLRCRHDNGTRQIVPAKIDDTRSKMLSIGGMPVSKVSVTRLPQPVVIASRTPSSSIVIKLLHIVALGWAVLVVSLHTQARRRSQHPIDGCLVVFPAWRATLVPCATLVFNCHARGELTGSSHEIHTTLAALEPSVLRVVVFSHCPALQIPPILVRKFPNLNALGTFNCTIATWDSSASIHQRFTPTLALLQLIDTNMSALPDGVNHVELPKVFSLDLFRSNLSHLPDTIGYTWGSVSWSRLGLEYTQLTSLPESFRLVQARTLSLEGSPVTSLPSGLLSNQPTLSFVRFSNTRLETLPSEMDDTSSLSVFLAEDTNVTHVPHWLRTWAAEEDASNRDASGGHVVSLRGSPVCELVAAETNAALCQPVVSRDRYTLPYAVIAALRPLHG